MVKRAQPRSSPPPTFFGPLPVLISESAEEFERFHSAWNNELKPRGPVERHLVDGMVENAWDICRLRRIKTSLVNSAWREGVKKLLEWLMPVAGSEMDLHQWLDEIDRLAGQWFGDESHKNEVLEILKHFGLDGAAVEAAAMKVAAPDLEKIDRLMALREARLYKGLGLLAELRGELGEQLHAKVNRVIDGKVIALEAASKKPPATAA